MSSNDQIVETVVATAAKDAWVKPEITSFAAAVEAQGVGFDGPDGSGGNVS